MKTKGLLFLSLTISMVVVFSGCEKDEDNTEKTPSFVGTWVDGHMRFVITENIITQQTNLPGPDWTTVMEGTYVYNSSKKSITTNITKTYITENSGVVELPYTDTTMGVTWTAMTREESVAIAEQENETILMFQAYFGGNTTTLLGEWSTIYSMSVEMEMDGETDVVDADMSSSMKIEATTMTLMVNELDESYTANTVTESANWALGSNSITITGGDNNEMLMNGVYDYKIIGSGLIVAQQGPGSDLIYMVKQ